MSGAWFLGVSLISVGIAHLFPLSHPLYHFPFLVLCAWNVSSGLAVLSRSFGPPFSVLVGRLLIFSRI